MKNSRFPFFKTDRSGMRGIVSATIFLAAVVCFTGSCTIFRSQMIQETPAGDAPEQKTGNVHRDKIFESLKKAADSGKSEITIFVDEDPHLIQEGDLVSVHVTAGTTDGSLYNTTRSAVAEEPGRKWLRGVQKGERFHPVEVIAGEAQGFPGVNETVVGMKKEERRTVTIPAEKAFGVSDPDKIKQYPAVRRVPRLARVEPLPFANQYRMFPVKGKKFEFNPYLNAMVMDVFETHAVLELSMRGKNEVPVVDYGTTSVSLEKDEFVIKLTPEIGASFEVENRKGWITAADGDTFTVDFNHPMAGKDMVLELEVIDFTKASKAHAYEISWLEDYSAGAEKARKEDKPMVLLLYAGWCQWSQKLMNEVLKDPRIMRLHDRFVWVKIDSDVHREYKDGFEQKSYPKLLILSPQGKTIKSLDGFNNVHIVSETLTEIEPLKSTG